MKKIIILFFAAFLFTGLSSFQNSPQIISEKAHQIPGQAFQVPDNIQLILDNNCLQCHGTEGSGKAKMKWNYDKMSNMKVSKMVSKLAKISDEVNEEKMPPKKYIKKHPEKKLSPEDKKLLIDWAETTAQNLIAN